MMSKFGWKSVVLLAALAGSLSLGSTEANGQDPAFGFLYGYSVGQSQRFRSNLPTPPYFSIYPPVYYGERYARPYGDSPFASWPTLQSNPAYRPEPKQDMRQGIVNPYCSPSNEHVPAPAPVAIGKKVTIINPYVLVEEEPKIAAK